MLQTDESSAQETVYYQDGSVLVTNTRAVLSAKTYAMANITSVTVGMIPANRAWGITLIILSSTGFVGSVLTLCAALLHSASNDAYRFVLLGAVGSLCLLGGGILLAWLPQDR